MRLKAHDRDGAGQNEEHARDQAAGDAMQKPAKISRKLLRLGPRQQHAEVQRLQETRLADPALFLDEEAMHDGDLPGRTAEAGEGDLRPCARRLFEADRMWRRL